jgi:hypothetical protein
LRQTNPDGSDKVVSYTGMDGWNKRKWKRISPEPELGDSRCKSPAIVPSIEGLDLVVSAILEERPPQPNNDLALVDSHVPVESSASTVEENPQHVSLAPEAFPTDEKADPAASTDKLVTTSEIRKGLGSSIILSSSPEADTQSEHPDQIYPLVACTHPVSTAEPTESIKTSLTPSLSMPPLLPPILMRTSNSHFPTR